MVGITVNVTGVEVKTELVGHLTAGMVGVPVRFELDDAWEGLLITAVFRAGDVVRDVELDGMDITVPWEVLSRAYQGLEIGIEGRNEDGSVVIPTLWGVVGEISPGANVSANPALDPTLTRYDSIIRKIQALDDSIPAWSREPEKPKYSAAEVNALSADTLQESVMLALDEAKQSGRFDGPKGDTGVTPTFTIGEVETLDAGTNATASITGTAEKPVLNLGIPKGEKGEGGSGGGGLGGADWNAAEGEPGHVLNRTHYYNTTYDIAWDGDMTGRATLDLTAVGWSGGYIVKVSDSTPTTEELIGGKMYRSDGVEFTLIEDDISANMFPGARTLLPSYGEATALMGVIIDSAEMVESAIGLPSGTLTNGVYFCSFPGVYVSRLTDEDILHLDPKYIKDMYYENTEVLLQETSPEYNADDGSFDISPALNLKAGETYTVTYNGEEYECECAELTDVVTAQVLGNVGLVIGSGDSGEPFVVMSIAAMGVTQVRDLTGATFCTVSVSQRKIKKIDDKYIDTEWMAKKTVEPAVIVPETTVTLTTIDGAAQGCYGAEITSETVKPFALGETYIVTIDGMSFSCSVRSFVIFEATLYYLGNLDLTYFSDAENTGEQFCIISGSGMYGIYAPFQGDVVFKLESKDQVTETYARLPEVYLPESVDGVVIRSSTEGSTKKFKLTVDDSGTITATQVNE